MLFKPSFPHGFAGRCFPGLGCQSSITPLTCTLFDPCIFSGTGQSSVFRLFIRPLYLPKAAGRSIWQIQRHPVFEKSSQGWHRHHIRFILPVTCLLYPFSCLLPHLQGFLRFVPFLPPLHKAPNRADIPAGGYISTLSLKTGHKGLQGATKAGESFPPPVIFSVLCQIPISAPILLRKGFCFSHVSADWKSSITGTAGFLSLSFPKASLATLSSIYSRVVCGTYFS